MGGSQPCSSQGCVGSHTAAQGSHMRTTRQLCPQYCGWGARGGGGEGIQGSSECNGKRGGGPRYTERITRAMIIMAHRWPLPGQQLTRSVPLLAVHESCHHHCWPLGMATLAAASEADGIYVARRNMPPLGRGWRRREGGGQRGCLMLLMCTKWINAPTDATQTNGGGAVLSFTRC